MSFERYLRAAIPYFRLLAETSDPAMAIDAITKRIECEDAFRKLFGRSFLSDQDSLSYEEVLALAAGAKTS